MDKKRRAYKSGMAHWLPRLSVLPIFFLFGVFLGQVAADRVPDTIGKELSDYLRCYVALESNFSLCSVTSAFLLYFRYPLLALLLGFSSIGMVLLPCLTIAFGFFLSFSICCFAAAFGSGGILLAISVFGLRCFVTLPCYFLLAVPALRFSASLAALSVGKERTAITYGRSWWMRILTCIGILLAGACIDLIVSPRLLSLTLGYILF